MLFHAYLPHLLVFEVVDHGVADGTRGDKSHLDVRPGHRIDQPYENRYGRNNKDKSVKTTGAEWGGLSVGYIGYRKRIELDTISIDKKNRYSSTISILDIHRSKLSIDRSFRTYSIWLDKYHTSGGMKLLGFSV